MPFNIKHQTGKHPLHKDLLHAAQAYIRVAFSYGNDFAFFNKKGWQ
jgi:hypothetical protein